MIFFISPAKTLNTDNPVEMDTIENEKTQILGKRLKTLSVDEIADTMKIKNDMAQEVHSMFENLFKDKKRYCALDMYSGIQYRNIDFRTLSDGDAEFLNRHMRIISALYGSIRPLSYIQPYRLEMLTKLQVEDFSNLYSFWGESIYNELKENLDDGVIVNLASNEYSKCIKKYAKMDMENKEIEEYIEIVFKTKNRKGEYKVMSTASKTARGKMVRWIASNRINSIEELKKFDVDNFRYAEDESETDRFVFIQYD